MLDVPKYRTQPSAERMLFSRALILLCLGFLLYTGVYINYYLLNINVPALANWIILTGILLLLIIEAILCYVKYSKFEYTIYSDKITSIEGNRRTISMDDVASISYDQKVYDRWFKSGTIIFNMKDGKKFMLRHLKDYNKVHFLVQKLKP